MWTEGVWTVVSTEKGVCVWTGGCKLSLKMANDAVGMHPTKIYSCSSLELSPRRIKWGEMKVAERSTIYTEIRISDMDLGPLR